MVRAPNLNMNFGGSLRCGGVAFLLPKIAEICIFCFAGVFFFFCTGEDAEGGGIFDQSGKEAQGDFKI